MLVLAGRVFGPGFGFTLGCTTLFASAMITGGVGPWMPYQMFGCAWVGLGAGLLPRCTGRREIAMLAAYGVVAGVRLGFLLNLSFWPFSVDPGSSISYLPGAALHREVAPLPGVRRDDVTRLGHGPRGDQLRSASSCSAPRRSPPYAAPPAGRTSTRPSPSPPTATSQPSRQDLTRAGFDTGRYHHLAERAQLTD